MISTIESSYPTYPIQHPPLPSRGYIAATRATEAYANDQLAFDPNAQAGIFKRMGQGLGQFFSAMADWFNIGQVSQFAKVSFAITDKNATQSLDAYEYQVFGVLTGVPYTATDQNQDQKVSYNEFKAMSGEVIKTLFVGADYTGDGYLNYAESQACGYRMLCGSPVHFSQLDANQDGLLSRHEFMQLCTQVYQRNLF